MFMWTIDIVVFVVDTSNQESITEEKECATTSMNSISTDDIHFKMPEY